MLRGIEELCDQQQTRSLLQAASIKHSSYPTPFSSAFVILKSLWSAELLLSWGKTHRDFLKDTPASTRVGWSISEQGQHLPVVVPEHLLLVESLKAHVLALPQHIQQLYGA